MIRAINIVVTCTNQKKYPSPQKLKLRSIRSFDSIGARCDKWLARLDEDYADRVVAQDLYAGDHWTNSRDLVNAAAVSKLKANLWICSAGYGLISATTRLQPYAATFASGHLDSVTKAKTEVDFARDLQSWWRRMGSWDGTGDKLPRTISDLATEYPTTPLMVVGSRSYVLAMHEDLLRARKRLRSADYLCIISTGVPERDKLFSNVIPCAARLQPVVGGAMTSLNVRIAKKILLEAKQWPIRVSVLQERYNRLMARQPEARTYNRKRMTDDETRRYISGALRKEKSIKPSPLLRRLRDSGYACEQARFSELFYEVNKGSSWQLKRRE